MEKLDVAIIGAGCVGAGLAYALRASGREVFVLEREAQAGMGMTSRNSGVVHAGIYYPENSLKTELCRRGNAMLHQFAPAHDVPFAAVGKYIVATSDDEVEALQQLYHTNQAAVPLAWCDPDQLPQGVACRRALFSPSTAIIDPHHLVTTLLDQSGAECLYHQQVEAVSAQNDHVLLTVNGETYAADWVFNCTGLAAASWCPPERHYLARGVYFQIRPPRDLTLPHLVYPAVPKNAASLGVHLTRNLAGECYLGPDLAWIEHEHYHVDPARGESFYRAAKTYLPWLQREMLQPGYAGIRAKLNRHAWSDFTFRRAGRDGRLIHCLGIESPGLTASMAIGAWLTRETGLV